jgi:hypothetical protein
MSKYVPFLKLKQGEIFAVSEIKNLEGRLIVPFFEIPRDAGQSEAELIKKILSAKGTAERKLPPRYRFYLDNYEVDDEITVGNRDNYEYLLSEFSSFVVIPVTGFDRTPIHHEICVRQARLSNEIAIRITPDFLEGASVYISEIKPYLDSLPEECVVTVIIDYRLVASELIQKYERDTMAFIKSSTNSLRMSQLLLTGSSIEALSGDMVDTGDDALLTRHEINLITSVCRQLINRHNIHIGDYTTISPDFSEVNLPMGILAGVMCPRITYSTLNEHYLVRGNTFRRDGWEQYRYLATKIMRHSFYRGENYSTGDRYIYEKSQANSKNGSPGAMVRHSANAHMEMMLNCFDSILN